MGAKLKSKIEMKTYQGLWMKWPISGNHSEKRLFPMEILSEIQIMGVYILTIKKEVLIKNTK